MIELVLGNQEAADYAGQGSRKNLDYKLVEEAAMQGCVVRRNPGFDDPVMLHNQAP
jgi:hypothetical protein